MNWRNNAIAHFQHGPHRNFFKNIDWGGLFNVLVAFIFTVKKSSCWLLLALQLLKIRVLIMAKFILVFSIFFYLINFVVNIGWVYQWRCAHQVVIVNVLLKVWLPIRHIISVRVNILSFIFIFLLMEWVEVEFFLVKGWFVHHFT